MNVPLLDGSRHSAPLVLQAGGVMRSVGYESREDASVRCHPCVMPYQGGNTGQLA
jgi:hypothetical protein